MKGVTFLSLEGRIPSSLGGVMNSKLELPARWRVLVVCTHLRPGRDKRRSSYFMQPITGLHIGSLIDQTLFDVRLHHEDWHGPLDPTACTGYSLVFLTGLQVDFDRMRQLAFF